MIKILAITPEPSDGTSFYRAFGPLSRLQKTKSVISVTDGSSLYIDWKLLSEHDIIFMQRPFSNDHARIAEVCEIHRIPLILDYDDDLFNVGEHNHAYELYKNPHILENIRYICSKAEVIWVSTEHLSKVFGEFGKTVVIENGIDLSYFPMQRQSRRKVIAYRGGDSHSLDFDEHYDSIMEIYAEFPEYEWVFFGWCPDKIKENMEPSRLSIYKFANPWVYMRNLCEVRPEILIVPLQDTYFNKSKSDVSFLEATVAGAITFAPVFIDAFKKVTNLWLYPNTNLFQSQLSCLINIKDKKHLIEKSQKEVSTNRSLDQMNFKRYKSIKDVIEGFDTNVQIRLVEDAKPATDKEFYDFEYHMGVNLDNEGYREKVKQIVDNLVKELNPSNVLDIGCGCGVYVAEFLRRDIIAYGIEPNKIHKEDWDNHFPDWKDHFKKSKFLEVDFDGTVADLAICIEVLEHIPSDVAEKWIEKMGSLCKKLLFTSTPYADSPYFDKYWGHVNVKQEAHWIELFKKKGFHLVKKHKEVAIWGLLFLNANL